MRKTRGMVVGSLGMVWGSWASLYQYGFFRQVGFVYKVGGLYKLVGWVLRDVLHYQTSVLESIKSFFIPTFPKTYNKQQLSNLYIVISNRRLL